MEFSLSANFPAKVSQLCRTRIIERDKIILRKSLQLNNRQKTSPPSTGSAWIAVPWIWRKRKDPSSGFAPTRGQAKGRWKGQKAMAVEMETSPSTRSVPIHGPRPHLFKGREVSCPLPEMHQPVHCHQSDNHFQGAQR